MIEIDMADVRPSLISFITVGVMAVVFIILLKWLASRTRINALNVVANAV